MMSVQEKTQTMFVFFLSKALAWEGAAETITACEIRAVFKKKKEVGGKEDI